VVVYDKCLLATGGTPKSLAVLDDASDEVKQHVNLFRTTKDFERLKALAGKSKKIAVVGGGFLGSELAVALAHYGKANGLEVTQIYPERGNMAKVLPAYLSQWSTGKVEAEGVHVVPNSRVVDISMATEKSNDRTPPRRGLKELSKVGAAPSSTKGAAVTLRLDNGVELEADEVVVAVGIQPNTELAEKAGGAPPCVSFPTSATLAPCVPFPTSAPLTPCVSFSTSATAPLCTKHCFVRTNGCGR
jgi:programmed cell death 8 (apoptosis-inducing factor)